MFSNFSTFDSTFKFSETYFLLNCSKGGVVDLHPFRLGLPLLSLFGLDMEILNDKTRLTIRQTKPNQTKRKLRGNEICAK
jgi:hypothetical protein